MRTNQPVKAARASVKLPRYLHAEQLLRAKIQQGFWATGAKLPSRKDLAQEFGVAIATMERAIGNLLSDGTLSADGARGTFVADPNATPAPRAPGDHILRFAASSEAPIAANLTLGIVSARSNSPIANDLGAMWIRSVTQAVEQVFSSAGGSSYFYNRLGADGKWQPMTLAVETFVTDRVDAIIVILCDDDQDIEEVAGAAQSHDLPIVFITSKPIRIPLRHVFYDNFDAGYQAAKHLLDRGYRELAYINPFDIPWATERLAGAREAVRQAGIPGVSIATYPDTLHEHPVASSARTGVGTEQAAEEARAIARQTAEGLSTRDGFPKAMIAANDNLAFEIMRAAHAIGMNTGEHYALVGFDDDPMARVLGLSTIRPPFDAMAEEAAKMLLMVLTGRDDRAQVRFRSQLIARRSSLPACTSATLPEHRSAVD